MLKYIRTECDFRQGFALLAWGELFPQAATLGTYGIANQQQITAGNEELLLLRKSSFPLKSRRLRDFLGARKFVLTLVWCQEEFAEFL